MLQETPHEIDIVEKVKINARDLRIGMYVCELDRPWLETPFLFQGFELKTFEDIVAVQNHCKYVFIDILRTRVEEVRINSTPSNNFGALSKTTSFSRELETAGTAAKNTSSLLKTMIDDVRFGSSIDIQLARESVSECVSSIMRNPDALLFMTQMREKSELLSQHAMNTSVYAIMVGRLAGLDAKQLEDLGTCGLMHDIGKVQVPDAILNKPDRLTSEEMDVVRQHCRLGRDILMSGRNIYSGTVDVAFGHHEHLDGSGYPRGLTRPQLNRNVRIVAVVEKYDAIVSPRPHRPAFTHLDALNMLHGMVKKNHLEGKMVNAFIAYMGIYPPGSIVELSTGEKAIVLETNPSQRLRPTILVVRDPAGNPVARFVDMALKQTDEKGLPYKIKAIHRPGDFGINLLDYRGVVMKSLG